MPEHDETQKNEAEETKSALDALSQEKKEEVDDNPDPTPRQTYSETERRAMEHGWLPKDDFKGDPERWVTAHQFLDRVLYMDKISVQNKQLEELKHMNKALMDMMKEQQVSEKERKAEKILKLKRAAIEEGNVDQAEKYEEQFHKIVGDKVYNHQAEVVGQADKGMDNKDKFTLEERRVINQFFARNANWYNKVTPMNEAMMAFAIAREREIALTQPQLPLAERLELTEKQTKIEFPQVFDNQNRTRAKAVESNTHNSRNISASPNKNKITYKELPTEVKKVIDEMASYNTNLDKDKYAQELLDKGYIAYE
jgi:hypothetical protein